MRISLSWVAIFWCLKMKDCEPALSLGFEPSFPLRFWSLALVFEIIIYVFYMTSSFLHACEVTNEMEEASTTMFALLAGWGSHHF